MPNPVTALGRANRGRIVAGAVVAMMAAALAMAAPAAAASLTVTPTSAASGQTVSLTGTGYAANDNVTLMDNGVIMRTDILTNNQGGFTTSYTVPPNSNVGNHVLEVHDRFGATAQTNLNVTSGGGCTLPTLSVTPQTAPSGGTINLSGSCYVDNETVRIIVDSGQEIGRVDSTGGNFTTSATVPSLSAGTHLLTARGLTSGREASTQLTIDNGLTNGGGCGPGGACFYNTTPTASPGQQIALYGRGYDPGEDVIVTADNGATVARTTSDAQGNFTTTGTVPQNLSPGQHMLVARGTRSQREDSDPVNVVDSYGQGSNVAYPPAAYQAPPGAGAPYPPGASAAGPYGPGYGPGYGTGYGVAPQAVGRLPGATPPAVTQAVGTSRIPFTGAKVRALAFVAVSLLLGGLLLLSARAVLRPTRS
jgi:hypothetical protein